MRTIFYFGLATVLAGVLWATGCRAPDASSAPSRKARAGNVEPVTMVPRTLRPPEQPPAGERLELRERDMPLVLFLPSDWTAAEHRGRLAIHFHTSDWVAIGEHLRAGYRFPLVAIFLGSGSTRYREPFADTNCFARLLAQVEAELSQRGATQRIHTVDVSSFSAGYGAVRELVQQSEAFARIQRIVLSDSLYGGLSGGANGQGPRVVQPDHVTCWLPFARAAKRGRKTLALTYSEVPTAGYASTGECAAAILAALGLKSRPVTADALPAAAESTYPLRRRADAGNLHFWGYASHDASAHMVHPRHLAEVWRVLDARR